MNAKHQVSRKQYNDPQGHSHIGYGAKAARKRDGLRADHARYDYYSGKSGQKPGSMKK